MGYLGTKPANSPLTSELIPNSLITNAKINDVAATKLTGQVPDANAPSGSVIQVVQTQITAQTIFSSSSYVDATSFSASITPSSTSSKILVVMNVHTYLDNFSTGNIHINGKIVRNSTDVYETLIVSGYAINITSFFPLIYLDSPATTSSTTYKLQVKASDTYNSSRINRNTTAGYTPVSTITLMEIAA